MVLCIIISINADNRAVINHLQKQGRELLYMEFLMKFNLFKVTLDFMSKNPDGSLTGGTCDLYLKSLKGGEEAYKAIEHYLYHSYYPLYPYVEFEGFFYTSVEEVPENEIVKEV